MARQFRTGDQTLVRELNRSILLQRLRVNVPLSRADLAAATGLNKTTVISVMKRALDLDPKHVRMTQGKRRKLYLAYVPEEDVQKTEASAGSDQSDRAKLELMAMT